MAKISLGRTELDSSASAVVLGCPGSGKTSSIIQLVTRLEQIGFAADEILVLTPSRLAANLLRDQLGVNSKVAAKAPRARSISSFAFGFLSKNNPDLKLLSGASQQALIAKLIAEAVANKQHSVWKVDALTCELQGFQTEVRDLLAVVIENGLSVADLKILQAQFQKTKLQVAIDLLPKYQELLKSQNAMDPSELLVRVKEQIEEADRPRCLIVDDAQDLSPAGLNLVAKLAGETLTYIFGDPDTAVLGFRSGADSFISHFNFPQKTLPIPEAASEKLSLLQRVANRIPTGLSVSHRPKSAEQVPLIARVFENQSAEADWLAAKLRRAKLVDRIGWDEMAVIARTRTQLDQLASDLSARSVPVRIVGVQQALKHQLAARAVLDFGALVYGLSNPQDLEQLLSSPLMGLDALGIRRLFRELAHLQENQGVPRSEIQRGLFSELVQSDSFEVKALNRLTEARFRLANQGEISAHQFVSAVRELMNLDRWQTLSRGRGTLALASGRDLDALLELFAAAQRFDLREAGSAAEFVRHQLEVSIP